MYVYAWVNRRHRLQEALKYLGDLKFNGSLDTTAIFDNEHSTDSVGGPSP